MVEATLVLLGVRSLSQMGMSCCCKDASVIQNLCFLVCCIFTITCFGVSAIYVRKRQVVIQYVHSRFCLLQVLQVQRLKLVLSYDNVFCCCV